MARKTFSHSVLVEAPRAKIWEALQRAETWEAIGGVERVHDAVIDEAGRLEGFAFEARAAGRSYPGLAVPHAREEGQVMAWSIDTSEVDGVIGVELGEEDDATRLTVTIEVESRSTLSAVFLPAIASAIGKNLPRAVEAFADTISDPGQSS